MTDHAALYDAADAAGKAAAAKVTPTPMIVKDNITGKVYHVPQGVCGFAWVNVQPGTSSFARWLKAHKDAYKDSGKGVNVWVGDYGQSMETKQAYARAFAAVLRDAGIAAHAVSLMD